LSCDYIVSLAAAVDSPAVNAFGYRHSVKVKVKSHDYSC